MGKIRIKNLKQKSRRPKVSRLLQNLCDSHKEIHTLGYGLKHLQKIYRLAYEFLFFVICISEKMYEKADASKYRPTPVPL
jgi:hypothetical protein